MSQFHPEDFCVRKFFIMADPPPKKILQIIIIIMMNKLMEEGKFNRTQQRETGGDCDDLVR